VSFERTDSTPDPLRGDAAVGRIEKRRDLRRRGVVAAGTLACPHCDAPVAPDGSMKLTDALWCPVCDHGGPVRDFLSLETPTRPAHVVVRVALGTGLRISGDPR
jgi:hypothetical protein